MNILVDAMGGDNAPEAVVYGCIDAVNEMEGFKIDLIGDSNRIKSLLNGKKYETSRINIVHAQDVISNDDIPTKAIRSKKNSSMVIGFNMLKGKEGEVFISAGNTGALMTGALLILGRIKGVDRPALAPVIPTRKGGLLLVDAGANTVCKPINYLQFGIMGSIYMKEVLGIANPKVGLINNGTEEKKGTEAVKQAYEIFKKSDVNFTGNVEGRDITDGNIDVAVCDGFVGNILLKFFEGIGSFMKDSFKVIFSKNILSKLAAVLVMGELKKFSKKIDYTEYGGALLLGVNGKVMKSHGSSNSKAIKNAVLKAFSYGKSTVIEQIAEKFMNMEVENLERVD